MAEQRSSRSKSAVALDAVAPRVCPPYEKYKEVTLPIWKKDPRTGLQEDVVIYQPGDKEAGDRLLHILEHRADDRDRILKGRNNLERAIEVYKMLPQSYKDRIWRKAADNLIPNHNDAELVPDSAFLPKIEMTDQIWDNMGCRPSCAGKDCPWKEECDTFYKTREPRWRRQKENSQICYSLWLLEKESRRRAALETAKAERYQKRMEQERIRLAAEKELSRTMFNPVIFENGATDIPEIIEHITTYIKTYKVRPVPHPDSAIIPHMIQVFTSRAPLTVLDFQCLIADYFHDGIPGFRVANLDNPKISGIQVHDLDIIRIGKKLHHMFMYKFLQNILTMMASSATIRQFRLISNELKRVSDLRETLEEKNASLFKLPEAKEVPKNPQYMPHMRALEEWRKSIGLHGGRVEDSIGPLLGIPHIGEEHTHYDVSLESVKRSNPRAIYDAYLRSKKKYLMITLKKNETKTLTQGQADRILSFILLVLFGPSYEQKIVKNPAMFTFDAHKGHMNHIIQQSTLPNTYRLITPYNIADSAMTETFDAPVENDQAMGDEEDEELTEVDRQVAAEIAKELEKEREQAKHSSVYRNIKQDELEQEDEDDEDDQPPQAQGRNYFAFSLTNIGSRAEISNTNMIFDNHWSIYYKNKNFREGSQYDFSMNLMDVGLHRFIERNNLRISPSLYTIEAPFSARATRGPSLNYLMMGLLRGSKSNIFDRHSIFSEHDELYDKLYSYRKAVTDPDFIKKLLPIYSIPSSSRALPLFQYIAKAPLFACHMLYDLQHRISALPSRIKWAGDREQYMALQGYDTGVFVTLDTTGYYCALANGITSLLERKESMIMIGSTVKETLRGSSTMTPQRQEKYKKKNSDEADAPQNLEANDEDAQNKTPSKKRSKKGGKNLRYTYKRVYAFPQSKKGTHKNVRVSPQETQEKTYTIDRNYLFLGWLYPLVMAVHEVFHDRHRAEDAYIILQNLKNHVHHPLLFSILQEQLFQMVLLIPDRPEKLELLAFVKKITMDTYDSIAPQCASLLKHLYTPPILTIFSNPIHKETLLSYLREMKQKLSKRYSSKDSTLDLLHTLLDPSYPNQESSCLVLSLLFERLHGRIQNGTSYLGQILGITGGPELQRVDDQEAWEHLTTVMEEDMAWITDLSRQAVAPMMASMRMEVAPAKATMPAETPITDAPKMFRLSAKNHKMVRGPVYRKMNQALKQLRSNRVRAVPMAAVPMAAVRMSAAVAGGALKKTRRAKKGSRQSQRRKD